MEKQKFQVKPNNRKKQFNLKENIDKLVIFFLENTLEDKVIKLLVSKINEISRKFNMLLAFIKHKFGNEYDEFVNNNTEENTYGRNDDQPSTTKKESN